MNDALDKSFIDSVEDLIKPNGGDAVNKGVDGDIAYFQFIGDATEMAVMLIERKMLAHLANPNISYRLNVIRGSADRK